MKTALTILVLTGALLCRADTLTLTNGDKLTGDIIAETDTNLQIRVSNPTLTITSVQTIPRATITGIARETPAEKTERAAYEKLCAYRLRPDQEYTAPYYTAVITALDKFLTDHPGSAYAPLLRTQRADWHAELTQLQRGLVKYHNGWISPADKTTLLQQAADKLKRDTAAQRLADLQTQRTNLKIALDTAEASLADAERALDGLQDFTQPLYEFYPITGAPTVISTGRGRPFIWSSPFLERYEVGEKVTRNPMRTAYENNVAYYRNRIARLRELLAQTEQSLATITPEPAPK